MPESALLFHRMTDHWVAALLAPLAFWVLLNGIDDVVHRYRRPCSATYFASIRQIPTSALPPKRTGRRPAPPDGDFRGALEGAQGHPEDDRQQRHEAALSTLRFLRRRLSQRLSHHRRGGGDREALPQRSPGTRAARRPHFQSRQPQLDLSAHAAARTRTRRPLRHDPDSRRRRPDGPRRTALDQLLRAVQRHGADPRARAPHAFPELSHGVYCDEFAEFQFKDMPARQLLGGFIPSNGVGTGFSRRALETLAEKYSNRIFEPPA